MLVNKEFVFLYKPNIYTIVIYTETEEISILFVDDVKAPELKRSYYLSDEIVDKFQPNLVGKSKSGKYIVMNVVEKGGKNRLELYEILELTETTLKTNHLRSGTILEYKVE